MDPWLYIVLLGLAIAGYAWMLPRSSGRDKNTEYVSEAAYDRLLEDLETENRELVDAVAKFKKDQDETVEKLGRRIVDMEHLMKSWMEQQPQIRAAAPEAADVRQPDSREDRLPGNPAAADHFASLLESAAEQAQEVVVVPDTSIRGRYPELLQLHDKGRSIEQIAKAMGMNKGEVQLILQLVRREEEQHA